MVFLGKALVCIAPMLQDAAVKVVGDTGVQGSVPFARQSVDVLGFHGWISLLDTCFRRYDMQ